MSGIIEVATQRNLGNQSAGFEWQVTFRPTGPVAFLEIHLDTDLTETGGSAAVTDTTILNGIRPLTITAGEKDEFLQINGPVENDYATHMGEIGLLQQWLLGSQPMVTGDASVAASGTEKRDAIFRLPVNFGDEMVNKDVTVRLQVPNLTNFTAGTGAPRMDVNVLRLGAYYVTRVTHNYAFARKATGAVIGASVSETELSVPDKAGHQLVGMLVSCIRSSAYEEDFTRFQLVSSGERKFWQKTKEQCDADVLSLRSGTLMYQYASTYTFRPVSANDMFIHEGLKLFRGPPVEAKNLRLLIDANANASSSDARVLFVYRKPAGQPKSGEPTTAATQSTADQTGSEVQVGA